MFRLLSTLCHAIANISWASGPGARSSGSSTAMDGSEQTFDTYGDVVALQIDMDPKQGRMARRERGLLTALPNGNAFRFKYLDRDMPTPYEAGIAVSERTTWRNLSNLTWDNGMPWDNGAGWQCSAPVVPVERTTLIDSSVINLEDEWWGHDLGVGDHLGFFPYHFGVYTITEVMGEGRYRVWPRLRKDITPDTYCTLHPTLVLKISNRQSATWSRGRWPQQTSNVSLTCVEVPDYYVRDYYEG